MNLVILACGNPSRGDDALGPALMDALRAQNLAVDLVEDFQFQVEHALDLAQRDRALFVDAAESGPSPYCLSRVEPLRHYTYTTHSMSPEAVLHAYTETHSEPPPPAFLLSIRGESFNLGEPMTEAAQANLQAALDCFMNLYSNPDLDFWNSRLSV